VYVYKKFWKDADEIVKNAAPPILVYADLINTGNKRCIETAQNLYEKYLKNHL
jgi:hypothetical protein